jgi:hypothetical protein
MEIESFKNGDEAEKFLIKKYIPSLGLKCRKIKEESRPDIWVLNNKNEKVALAEIKFIKNRSEVGREIDFSMVVKTINGSLHGAKKQLKSIKTNLPKIIYLIIDEKCIHYKEVLWAMFGPTIIVTNRPEGKIIKNCFRSFDAKEGRKYKQDRVFRDHLLSAIICLPKKEGYKPWIFRDNITINIPEELLDSKNLNKYGVYFVDHVGKEHFKLE